MTVPPSSPEIHAQDGREVRHILIIRFGGIGDILMTTPTLRALHARYPDAAIDYLVNGGFRDAIQGHPAVRRVLEFHKRGWDLLPHRCAPFLWSLHRERYDLVVNLQPSVKTRLITCAAAPERALVFYKDQTMQPQTRRRRHAINDFYATIRPLGVPDLCDRQLDFHVPPAARTAVDRLLREVGYSAAQRLIVVHPAANHRVNRWPATHFRALSETLISRGDTIVALTGHKNDQVLARSILAKIGSSHDRTLDLSGRLSLKELGALLERAELFVTADTGPMHIACATGTPVVGLFGAADPDRTGPVTTRSHVLADRSLPCAPCHARTCQYGSEARCMQMLTPGTVLAAIDDLMRNSWQSAAQAEAVKPI